MPPASPVPAGGGGTHNPNAEEKAKRVRSLLSSYYGAGGADSADGGSLHDDFGNGAPRAFVPAGGVRESPRENRVAGLDSASFDVDR